MKLVNLYKSLGMTPREAVEAFRERNPAYKDVKLGYAGRLDPMAGGVLLVLIGEENKRRKEYERLKKSYSFEVLFGFETDSYDVLGIADLPSPRLRQGKARLRSENYGEEKQKILKLIQHGIKSFIGKQMQEYPPYSSPRIKGKPLFWWARENRLSEITIPQKEIEIYSLKLVTTQTLSIQELEQTIHTKIEKVRGNFRQKEILKRWDDVLENCKDNEFLIGTFELECSSGTYVRVLAHELGKKLEVGGVVYSLVRTRVGNYTLEDIVKLETGN